ncbi:MAG: phosphate starvation-inducible protein PhoH, partial [Desulfosalsimonadaceae bacterium]|nr:phosphate starvation-inducible protein PhoH [Desulfosalsimonadaceae bacterium]
MSKYQKKALSEITFADNQTANELFGAHNGNLNRIAESTGVTISARGTTVTIEGDTIASDLAGNILNQLYELIRSGYPVYPKDVEYA